MKKLLFIPLFTLMAWGAQAQKNTVNLELFTVGQSHYNLSYERLLLSEGRHHFAMRGGLAGRSLVDQLSVNLEAVYYFGTTHQLETGFGAFAGTWIYNSSESVLQTFDQTQQGLFFRVGYAFKPANQPWTIRVGLMAETAREQVKPLNFSRSFRNYLLPYVGVSYRF